MEILYTTGKGSHLNTVKKYTSMKAQETIINLMTKVPWNQIPSLEFYSNKIQIKNNHPYSLHSELQQLKTVQYK